MMLDVRTILSFVGPVLLARIAAHLSAAVKEQFMVGCSQGGIAMTVNVPHIENQISAGKRL